MLRIARNMALIVSIGLWVRWCSVPLRGAWQAGEVYGKVVARLDAEAKAARRGVSLPEEPGRPVGGEGRTRLDA